MYDRRKSCERCSSQKKKCDGETPCSRCVEKGVEGECTYGKRRVRICTPYRRKRGASLEAAGATQLGTGHGESKGIVLKRYRFSASPATGLVGMQENVFLNNFFVSVGFLPLATRRDVRGVIVALMMSPSRQQATATRDCDVENKFDTIVSEDKVGNTWEGDDLTKICTFWCAVAIGALAKGHPVEFTASYFQLAKEALARYSGPTNFGLAKAWTILAYLHGFVGDMDGFYEYLALSDNFVRDSEQRESLDSLPVGFSEVVKHGETVKLFTGAAEEEEVESILAQEISFPKRRVVAPEAHICRYVMQYQRATELSIQQAVRKTGGTTQVGAQDAELTDDGVVKGSNGGDEMGGTCSPGSVPKCSETGYSDWDQIPMPVFPLEDAAERTNIRAGLGGLIINGILFFDRALKGDSKGALERIGCCVDIFEVFPGLARFGVAKHIAHIMLSMAASMWMTLGMAGCTIGSGTLAISRGPQARRRFRPWTNGKGYQRFVTITLAGRLKPFSLDKTQTYCPCKPPKPSRRSEMRAQTALAL